MLLVAQSVTQLMFQMLHILAQFQPKMAESCAPRNSYLQNIYKKPWDGKNPSEKPSASIGQQFWVAIYIATYKIEGGGQTALSTTCDDHKN